MATINDDLDFLFTVDDEQILHDNNNNIEEKNAETNDRKRRAEASIIKIMAENLCYIPKSKKVESKFDNPLNDVVFQTLSDSNDGCLHEVAYPNSMEFKPLNPPLSEPACEFPFKLDPFQSKAIQCIENSQSVLVSAHTSAGKTVCAQYAISMCLRENRRVIYTTPIKALSNQKYREFKEQYGSVGLMTGDVTIDENANVLIMTTEILRSMIYKNSSVLKEVGWLVFDEIHYMANKSRGYVWEEVLIQLPREHRMIFLSATIPNGPLFAKWIAYTHKKPCHIVYTDYRPTPLQHYIFPNTGETIYQIVDQTGQFIESNYKTAMDSLTKAGENATADTKNKGKLGGPKSITSHIEELVKKMDSLNKFPMIIFSFSKSDCETYARLLKKLEFNNQLEKDKIKLIYECAVKTLPLEDDQKRADDNLPELSELLSLMQNGIGIHHGGLLPVAKEITEILFQEGLIKILIATDTFAMGLNMPAKTVVFSSVIKFDGEMNRILTGAEYTQMAGRAGRRGIDETGECILILNKTLPDDVLRGLLSGVSEPLNSAFKLTFGTILSLARGNNANIEPSDLIRQSFMQFQAYAELPTLENKLKNIKLCLKQTGEDLSGPQISVLKGLAFKEKELREIRENKWQNIRNKDRFEPFMKTGRIVHIKCQDNDFGWGIVIGNSIRRTRKQFYELDVLIRVTRATALIGNQNIQRLHPITHENYDEEWDAEIKFCGEAIVACVSLSDVFEISAGYKKNVAKYIQYIKSNVLVRRAYLKKMDSDLKQHRPPMLHLSHDLHVSKKQVGDYYVKIEKLQNAILNHPLMPKLMKLCNSSVPDASLVSELCDKHTRLTHESANVENQIFSIQNTISMDQVSSKVRLLRKLGYLTENSVVTLKGCVACELASAGCNNTSCYLGLEVIVLTELLMDNILRDLESDKLAAVLTVFVLDESNKDEKQDAPLGDDLKEPMEKIKGLIRQLLESAVEYRLLSRKEDSPLNILDTRMVVAARAWALGCKFRRLIRVVGIMEGSVVRCIKQLHELLLSLKSAAIIMKNKHLENLFKVTTDKICRGIVFSSSLYTVAPQYAEEVE